jgi:putative thiamine transport system substrate-binding protein
MRLAALALTLALAAPVAAEPWAETLAAARGQTVWWHAWGGDPRTNDFIAGVAAEVQAAYGVTLNHVKLADTAEAVNRVVAERAAGRDAGGAVDLIWINGPNFAAMKAAGLLHGPFLGDLPNARFLDMAPGAAAVTDFTIPTEGYESPWRLARFVLTYDSARVDVPPPSMAALADWAVANPGRLTHPDAANFMGATFLKQALVELAPDPAVLASEPDDAGYAAATAPLWAWYDRLRPALWRQGRQFPETETALQQMLGDGVVDFAMAFDPAAAANAVERGLLPDTVRSYAFPGGTLGNISFVAIPYNSGAVAGAMVVANHLLDPLVQVRAQDVRVLGAFSVLDPARLDDAARAAFAALPAHPALPTLEDLGPTLAEPHPAWMTRIAADWAERMAR